MITAQCHDTKYCCCEDCHESLNNRVAELEKALAEAMEWNWLDDNADETIPAWIAETLKPKQTA